MRRFALISMLALTACDDAAEGGAGTDASLPAADALEARARIGPAGGAVAGPPGSELADFRLEVPPGALAAEAEVGLRAAFDGEPLGPTAERVGLQVEVTSEAAFGVPVRLVLPFDRGAVGRVNQGPADVKVWARAADGWTLLEPVATGDDTVTIELASPTIAAAGVRLVAAEPTCADCRERFALHRDPAACDESGLCLPDPPTDFGTLGTAHGAAPHGDLVAWLTPSGTDLIAEAFDPMTQMRVRGGIISPRSSVVANPALGADGALRLGLGSAGSARIPLTGGGRPILRSAPALGAVSLGNGLNIVVEFDANGPTLGVENLADPTSDLVPVVINHEEQFAPTLRSLPTLQPDPLDADRAFILSSGALYAFSIVSPRDTVRLERLADAPEVPAQAPLAIGRGPNGTLAATINTRGRVLTYIEQDNRLGPPTPLDLPFPARDIAFTDAGLVVVSATTPELAVVDLTERPLPQLFALSNAEAGTEAWTAALPRQVIRSVQGDVFVRRTDEKIMVIAVKR